MTDTGAPPAGTVTGGRSIEPLGVEAAPRRQRPRRFGRDPERAKYTWKEAGLAALWLLCGLLCFLGYVLCLFPVVFVFPFALGALHVAYRKVFTKPAAGSADPLRAAG